jgi:hypothetical protein
MLFNKSKHVLFRCETCATIVSVDFEDEDDIDKLDENKIVLECPCGGESSILRN